MRGHSATLCFTLWTLCVGKSTMFFSLLACGIWNLLLLQIQVLLKKAVFESLEWTFKTLKILISPWDCAISFCKASWQLPSLSTLPQFFKIYSVLYHEVSLSTLKIEGDRITFLCTYYSENQIYIRQRLPNKESSLKKGFMNKSRFSFHVIT